MHTRSLKFRNVRIRLFGHIEQLLIESWTKKLKLNWRTKRNRPLHEASTQNYSKTSMMFKLNPHLVKYTMITWFRRRWTFQWKLHINAFIWDWLRDVVNKYCTLHFLMTFPIKSFPVECKIRKLSFVAVVTEHNTVTKANSIREKQHWICTHFVAFCFDDSILLTIHSPA